MCSLTAPKAPPHRAKRGPIYPTARSATPPALKGLAPSSARKWIRRADPSEGTAQQPESIELHEPQLDADAITVHVADEDQTIVRRALYFESSRPGPAVAFRQRECPAVVSQRRAERRERVVRALKHDDVRGVGDHASPASVVVVHDCRTNLIVD